MKKIIALSFTAALIVSSIVSCKKGEHDPFLSLKSRKARLEGSWTVTAQETDQTSVDGGVTVRTMATYDGTMEIKTTTTTNGSLVTTQVDTSYYEYTLTIKKDGNYTQLIKNNNNLELTQFDGTWMFVGKSKLNNLKNKEAVLFTKTKSTILFNGFTNVVDYTDLSGTTVLIDQLKSKEMITISEVNSNNEDGLTMDKSLIKTTFTQK